MLTSNRKLRKLLASALAVQLLLTGSICAYAETGTEADNMPETLIAAEVPETIETAEEAEDSLLLAEDLPGEEPAAETEAEAAEIHDEGETSAEETGNPLSEPEEPSEEIPDNAPGSGNEPENDEASEQLHEDGSKPAEVLKAEISENTAVIKPEKHSDHSDELNPDGDLSGKIGDAIINIGKSAIPFGDLIVEFIRQHSKSGTSDAEELADEATRVVGQAIGLVSPVAQPVYTVLMDLLRPFIRPDPGPAPDPNTI